MAISCAFVDNLKVLAYNKSKIFTKDEIMTVVSWVLWALGVVFGLVYAYQVLFMIVGVLGKKKKYPEAKENHTFAIIISARNEEKVIGNLIDSIQKNDYPQDKLKIIVVADNCDDKTAQICRDKGCVVFERFNKEQIGKGYALNFLFKQISTEMPDYEPDAFMVFDADNILTTNYIKEMNKALDSGVKVCTSFRNSKNYGTNWLSAGASLGFIRECRFIHRPKELLKLSTHVSGTGFYVSKDVLTFKEGWKYVTLTEDLEFSATSTLKNVKIGYCEDAEFFDEQPSKFKQTWKQRLRWSKGALMGFSLFHSSLALGFLKTFNFSFYEYYFSRFFPAGLWYGFSFVASNIVTLVIRLFEVANTGVVVSVFYFLSPLLSGLLTTYLGTFVDGFFTTILNWKKIKAPARKKILYMFTYPVFNIIFSIPTVFVALFKKVKWDPIEHTQSITQEQLEGK